MVEAISISLYRMLVSKKHLLEWTTAADSEKMLGKDFISYLKFMEIAIFPILLFIFCQALNDKIEWIIGSFFLSLWMMAPWIAYHISQPDATVVDRVY